MAPTISPRQRDILEYIEQQIRERGYPPSVREIGDAVGLTSPSTVHSHLNTLQRIGYLRRDPTKRAEADKLIAARRKFVQLSNYRQYLANWPKQKSGRRLRATAPSST